MSVPAGDAAARKCLELSNDLGQLHVAFFLEVRQYSGAEEDLALTDAVQVGVEIQRLDLYHATAVCTPETIRQNVACRGSRHDGSSKHGLLLSFLFTYL